MASSKEYLQFVMDQLSDLEEITYRMMMGEYILYYRGKIAAYICDDRLLVKPVSAAREILPHAPMEAPYPGAKEMLLVEEVDDRSFLQNLLVQMEPQLPGQKKKKTAKGK
ncbi:TfoX/Sxy family protein [Anaerotignum sp.]|uniref:TfoX/Sxy family protein n=1 Tax=Anaerotignum sp. TaxID=2039241 RepID=UPI0037350491